MKRWIALLLAAVLAVSALAGCSERTAPQKPEEGQKLEAPSQPQKPDDKPDASKPDPELAPAEDKEEEVEDYVPDEEDDLPANPQTSTQPQSGTFLLLDSGYQITVEKPFTGVYDQPSDGFYISVPDDTSLQGIVSYSAGDEAVKSIEDNISALNQALKNDTSVYDFSYDREKEDGGLYNITFTYSTKADQVSSAGYHYVYYKRTPGGMLTVMFSCPWEDYAKDAIRVFDSVVPATDAAKEPPKR